MILNYSNSLIAEKIRNTIETKTFPEIWYLIENWLGNKESQEVLDFACGNGLTSRALAYCGWRVTSSDPSLDCLKNAKIVCKEQLTKIKFEQCSLEKAPFGNQRFDAVVSIYALERVKNPRKYIFEIYRMLKPGGKAVIASFQKGSPWANSYIYKLMRNEQNSSYKKSYSLEELHNIIRTQNFTVERISRKTRYLPGINTRIPMACSNIALLHKPVESEDKAKNDKYKHKL